MRNFDEGYAVNSPQRPARLASGMAFGMGSVVHQSVAVFFSSLDHCITSKPQERHDGRVAAPILAIGRSAGR